MWIQHRSLTLPSSPHRLSGLGAVYTLSHTHLLCHSVWDSYLPAIQWLSLHKVGILQPVLSGPLPCDLSLSTSHWLVDSTILWNSSPPLPSPWIQWTHRVWRFSSHCWKLMPGTLLLGSSWEHSSTLHPPHMETPGPPIGRGWTLTPRFSSLPVPRIEHSPGCQFWSSHFSFSLSPWYNFSVVLARPAHAALPYHLKQTPEEEADICYCSLTPCSWGVGES